MKKYGLIFLTLLLVSVAAAEEDSPADVMARNILEWISGIYRQGVRKTRQQSDNAYLPPYNSQRPPERPRPFMPASTQEPPAYSNPSQNEVGGGYPDYGSPATNRPGSTGYNPPQSGTSPGGGRPQFGGFPTSTTYLPPPNQPGSSAGYPYPSPGNRPTPAFPTPTGGRPTPGPEPATGPGPQPGSTPTPESSPGPAPGQEPGSAPEPEQGQEPGPTPGQEPGPTPGPAPEQTSPPAPAPGQETGPVPGPTPGSAPTPGEAAGPAPGSTPAGPGPVPAPGTNETEDDDLKHPPHIHSLDVQCSKTMMTINIEFNRVFDGVIYSKGFFNMPMCRYVEQNSGQIKYSFTVNLDSCGTQFISDFEGQGQAYLENVLVLQNEPGIQEVWDTVRTVRCLWEGNINKALTVSLSVDMLNQEIVTFSGDTATAKLDIQTGKGPFAPAANGLVRIGDPMTLVVSVEGDPGFDLQVRDCIARDESSANMYRLTDERGCILKPKIFGAFQKTKDTGNTGASIIAYAYFQAFKFPDVMDLFIECNVELCKTNCEPCPEANQQTEPGRRRRSISYPAAQNWTRDPLMGEAVRIGHRFRVVTPDDLPHPDLLLSQGDFVTTVDDHQLQISPHEEMIKEQLTVSETICLSYPGYYTAFATVLVALAFSSMSAALLFFKLQRIKRAKGHDLPSCS